MKKILFVIPKLATGGTNSSLSSLYPLLKERFDISVFSISHHPISHNYSFCEVLQRKDYLLSLIYSNYSDLNGYDKLVALLVKSIKLICKRIGVDIGLHRFISTIRRLESENSFDYIIGYQEGNATLFASLFSNPNKIAWIHADYNEYLPSEKTEESIYTRFKTIVSVSNYTTGVFARRYPSLADRAIAVHNVLDIPRIKHLAEQPIDDSRFNTEKYTIISVGRFGKVKRFSEIPAVASELNHRGMEFVWYVLGPRYQIEEVEAFKSNLQKFCMHDKVIWLGGKSNPYPYFKAANLYVCLSETEACPMVFKEALLFGCPVVTTDFPSSYEFIHDNDGRIAPFDKLPDAISDMKERYDRGYRIQPHEEDTKELVDKLCSILK